MTTHSTDNAVRFGTRKDCQSWIDARIVRFKLKMVRVGHPGLAGGVSYEPQKCDGSIFCKLDEDFKRSGTDEPLRNYAEPSKRDGAWVAFMKLR